MDMNDLFGDYQNGNYSSQKASTPMQENDFNNTVNNNSNVKTKAPKQKKGGGGKVFLILLLLALIAGGAFYVYAYTDVFRTPKELMGKYMINMFEQTEAMTPISNQITEKDTGTAIVDGTLTLLFKELSEGYMDDIDVNVNMEVDYDNSKAEFSINTEYEEEKIDFSVVTNENKIAVGTNLIDISEDFDGAEYVGIKNENLKSLFKTLEVDDETLEYIPDSINFDGLTELFTEEEIEDIKTRYLAILDLHLTDDLFSVEEKVAVDVDGKTYEARKINLKTSSSTLLDLLIDLLEELREDKTILTCYKKVVDVELPSDKIDEAFEEMISELKDEQESEKEEPSGTMEFALYVYKSNAIKFEVVTFDKDAKVLQEAKYYITSTENGSKTVTEMYQPESGYVPATTQINTIEVENGPTSEKITYTMETKYAELENEEEEDEWLSYFSTSSYEDTVMTYVYEIKDYSTKGYTDSLLITQDKVDVAEFSSKVKFDEEVSVPELKKSNTVFINDLSLEELATLINKIVPSVSGEEDYYEDDYDYSYDDDYNYVYSDDNTLVEDDFSNVTTSTITPDDEDVTVETNEPEVSSEFESEIEAALETCKTEAENSDYNVSDYVIADNLQMLCPSILSVETTQSSDTIASFDITTTDGKVYSLMVVMDGDTYTSSMYEK